MESISSEKGGRLRGRRSLVAGIKHALRDLRIQLSLLNHRVGSRADLRIVDLDCLDLLSRHGSLSPSALARRTGLHPATVTGILDRLERTGWVVRERGPVDRRAVTVRPLPSRARELFRLYAGANDAMDALLSDYDEAELALIADFLRRATEVGREATDALADGEESQSAE